MSLISHSEFLQALDEDPRVFHEHPYFSKVCMRIC